MFHGLQMLFGAPFPAAFREGVRVPRYHGLVTKCATDLFHELDKTGDGVLDIEELRKGVQDLAEYLEEEPEYKKYGKGPPDSRRTPSGYS